MRHKCIIFDCDGTLVDSEQLNARILLECATRYGLTTDVMGLENRFCGGTLRHSISIIETELGYSLPDDFPNEFRRMQAHAFRARLKPIDGARSVLRSLAAIPFCIASNAPYEKIELCLTSTGLDSFFNPDRIFSAFETGRFKPDPYVFLLAAQQMGMATAECMVVEDSRSGVLAAIAAGMEVCTLLPNTEPFCSPSVHHISGLRDLTGVLD